MFDVPKSFSLRYTEETWVILNEMAVIKGGKDFRSYINNRLHITAKNIQSFREANPNVEIFAECPKCEKKNNTFFIPEDIAEQIFFMAKQHCIPVTAFINMIHIDPLIKEYNERKHGLILL